MGACGAGRGKTEEVLLKQKSHKKGKGQDAKQLANSITRLRCARRPESLIRMAEDTNGTSSGESVYTEEEVTAEEGDSGEGQTEGKDWETFLEFHECH